MKGKALVLTMIGLLKSGFIKQWKGFFEDLFFILGKSNATTYLIIRKSAQKSKMFQYLNYLRTLEPG